MRNICQPVDGVCTQCNEPCHGKRYCKAGPMGHMVRERKPDSTVKHRSSPVCAWLGQPVEEMALVKCHTCRGNVKVKKILYDCPLFGRCLPKGKDEANAQQCMKCPSHTAKATH